MAVEMILPKFGLTMTEANIVRWLKNEGDAITAGEPLLEIETEKIVCEVEASATGTLQKIIAPAGTTVPVSTVIAMIEPA
jgi:pyruvate/2-oxoglutarate dehydrogenase complex dihydrolipoamide acyltransferase (E2) component